MEVDDSVAVTDNLGDNVIGMQAGCDAARPGGAGKEDPGNGVELPGYDNNADPDTPTGERGNKHHKKHRRGKNKGGHRHNKHWKPYHKLSWDERRELDERETRRANQKREERFASGQPMAPYNTTQFLMEQHQADEPEFVLDETNQHAAHRGDGGSGSLDSSDEYYDSPEEEDIFQAKEFSEEYDNVHAERLQNMTKDELVREYLEIESKVEDLEKKLKTSHSPVHVNGNNKSNSNGDTINSGLPNENIDIADVANNLETEIAKLREENEKLQRENDKLRANRQNSENTAKVAQIS